MSLPDCLEKFLEGLDPEETNQMHEYLDSRPAPEVIGDLRTALPDEG